MLKLSQVQRHSIGKFHWNGVKDAWIKDPNGKKLCEFKKNNLHLVGYSTPIHCKLSKSKLLKNLHSIPSMPDAIPYITSYYRENWGFVFQINKKINLKKGNMRFLLILNYSKEA